MFSTTWKNEWVCLVLLSVALLAVAEAQIPGCPGTPNTMAPLTSNATFVRSVPNGKLYMDFSVQPPLRIVHAWGSASEMGFAIGGLLRQELQDFLPKVLAYFETTAADSFPKDTPKWILDIVEKYGVPFALDMTYQMTKAFTPTHFEEELAGIASGSGVSLKELRRLNMIPELIKASCSMVGAWGPAISQTAPGSTLYQLRALDWDTNGPFNDYPAVMVYHPTDGVPFATLGWTGFVGALTGYSASNVGICEKYWGGYNGTYFDEGYPFHYLLRDILQFDPDISAAENRIMHADRTCAIFIGLGDNDSNQFRAVEYSHDTVNFYSDKSYPRYPGHPGASGLVYIDKHFQPSHDPCFGNALLANYGNLDANHLILAASLHRTGDNHAAVYDYARNLMYVSSASSAQTPPVIPAYNRRFVKFDLNKLWAEPMP
jgi:hypothetical protein